MQDDDCVVITRVDPYEAEFFLDPDEANIASDSPAGLKVLLPREFTNPPSAAAKPSESVTIPSEAPTFLDLDQEMWDTFGMLSEEFPERFIAQERGYYAATGHVRWAQRHEVGATALGDRRIWIMYNGGLIVGSTQVQAPAVATGSTGVNAISLSCSGQIRLDPGDYLSLRVYQGSTKALSVDVSSEPRTGSLSVCRISGRP